MRRTPYTARGIGRVPCARCGGPSGQQWNVCADPGYRGVCNDCDVALNRLVLEFFGLLDEERLTAYRESLS